MLIASHRHTKADLEIWRGLEAADLMRGRSRRMRRLIDSAAATVESFAADYAGVSWGKDSTVLAHLVDVPLVFVRPRNPLRTVDRNVVRDAFLASHARAYQEIVVDYSFDETESDRQFLRAFPSGKYFSGIRGNESGGRMIRRWKYGTTSPNTCAPLIDWTADDVFAYLAAHDLPVHPVYAMLGAGRWNRKDIRVDDLGGSRGDQFGRAEWEREYYGDVLARIEAR